MAELNLVKHIKSRANLPAFSLFESVISITIITVLIGLGTMIYGNVMNADNKLNFYQAQNEIDQKFTALITSNELIDKVYDYETYQIVQKVSFYNGNKNIYQIGYSVLQNNKAVWKENHLVINSSHE